MPALQFEPPVRGAFEEYRLAAQEDGGCLGVGDHALGRHRATVFLTLAADFGRRLYVLGRRRAGRARRKLGSDLSSAAWQLVFSGLADHMSPQEISGRFRRSCIIPGSH